MGNENNSNEIQLPKAVAEVYELAWPAGQIVHRGREFDMRTISLKDADWLLKNGSDVLIKKEASEPVKVENRSRPTQLPAGG